jgi:hypothetical protein
MLWAGGKSVPALNVFRDDLCVLILRGCNLPGKLIPDFTGFGKSSPYFAGENVH